MRRFQAACTTRPRLQQEAVECGVANSTSHLTCAELHPWALLSTMFGHGLCRLIISGALCQTGLPWQVIAVFGVSSINPEADLLQMA